MSGLNKISFLLPVPVAILVLLPSTQEMGLVCWGELENTDVLEQQKGGHRMGGGG